MFLSIYTHTPASLYKTFPPAEARRILQRLERDALSQCLEDETDLRRQVLSVETERNGAVFAFQFT